MVPFSALRTVSKIQYLLSRNVSDAHLIVGSVEKKKKKKVLMLLGTRFIYFDYPGITLMSIHPESQKDDPATKIV